MHKHTGGSWTKESVDWLEAHQVKRMVKTKTGATILLAFTNRVCLVHVGTLFHHGIIGLFQAKELPLGVCQFLWAGPLCHAPHRPRFCAFKPSNHSYDLGLGNLFGWQKATKTIRNVERCKKTRRTADCLNSKNQDPDPKIVCFSSSGSMLFRRVIWEKPWNPSHPE